MRETADALHHLLIGQQVGNAPGPGAIPDSLVPRPRLIDAIRSPSLAKVTSVVAGAGYGKSDLLATFANEADMPVAWVALRAHDNDPWIFTRHLMEALRHLEFGNGNGRAERVEMLEQHVDPDRLAFGVERVSGAFCLALDDCDAITNPRVFEILDAVIESLPPDGHAILSSRVSLPLRLARLRASGQVREIRQQDLRFTIPEAEALLRQRTRMGLPDDVVWHIWNSSAGWAAGIALAGMSWQGAAPGAQEDARHDTEARWHGFAVEYVEEEILRNLPGNLRKCLLLASDLPYLSNDLLAASMPSEVLPTDVESLVIWLPFLESAHGNKERLLMNPLVGSSLRMVARREIPASERQNMQARAIRYITELGDVRAAGRLIAMSLDVPWNQELIEPVCRRLAERSDFDRLLELVDHFPPEKRDANANLTYWNIVAKLGLGYVHGTIDALDRAEPTWQDSGDPLDLGRQRLCRGWVAYFAGRGADAGHLLRDAVTVLPQRAMTERLYAHTLLGQLDLDVGHDAIAASHLERAGAIAARLPIDEQWAWKAIGAERGNTYAFRGDLHSAVTKYELMIDELPVELAHLEGFLRCRLVSLWIERDDLERARTHLRLAERLRSSHPGGWHHQVTLAKARLLLAAGDIEAANHWASSYIKHVRRLPEKDQLVLLLAQIWISRGELALVRHWLADISATGYCAVRTFGDLSCELIAIEADLADGRDKRAAAEAAELAKSAASTLRWSVYIAAMMHGAVALYRCGDAEAARAAARPAIQRGVAGGFVRSLLVPGFNVVSMFDDVLQETREGQDLRRQLSRATVESTPNLSTLLTSREIEILKRVAVGESNKDIADSLFISAYTVRNHLVKAFRNLNARSRSEAVSRARELGLLD